MGQAAIPLRTRADLKAAGRAMAMEAVDAVAVEFASLSPEQMQDDARLEAARAFIVDAAVGVARTYRDAGIPDAWVAAFVKTYHRTAVARLADHSLFARPVTSPSLH